LGPWPPLGPTRGASRQKFHILHVNQRIGLSMNTPGARIQVFMASTAFLASWFQLFL